jgi:calcium-translocating P-type ATPase
VPSVDLVPGDVVLLEGGDNVPADCRIVEAFGVRVNNATITGESLPQSRSAEPCDQAELLHARNVLLAGTSLVSGEARAIVFATGAHSEFGQIAHLTQSTGEEISPLQMEIARVSRVVVILAVALGVVFFLIGQAIGLPFWANFIFGIGIIVANVPEGLLPTVTLALAMGSQRMAKRNALVRHLPAVETLGCTTVICTDKTGTLTRNEMTVKRLFIAGRSLDATPAAFAEVRGPHRRFFEVAACCHDLKEARAAGRRDWFGDPMEIALVEMAANALPELPHSQRINELPFDSQRKRLSTVHETGGGLVLYCKGAPEVILERSDRVSSDGTIITLSDEIREVYHAAANEMAHEGLRVLAFAWRELSDSGDLPAAEDQMILAGLVGLEDPPRAEVPEAIRHCRGAGIKVVMVTGDHPQTGVAIAREIGLVRSASPVVITGEELHRLSNTQLQLALDAPEIVFARVAADQKMRIVRVLKRKREIVAVTGDGVNDAPALRKADIGIAMGRTGSDVARESADMVLPDDNFATIVAAIEKGRAVYANIRKFLTYILTSNIPELVPYLAFVLFRIPLPLTIIQILAVDLGTDLVPALALGAEEPDPKTMKQPPRPREERLLSGALIARAYGWLGPMQAVAGMAAFFFVLKGGGWHLGEMPGFRDPLYLQATTASLSAIVVAQIANVFICRSERESAFGGGLLANRLILLGVAVEIVLILLIDYSAWGNAIFGTAPIPLAVWLVAMPFALGMLALEEMRKWFVRTWPGLAARNADGKASTGETPAGAPHNFPS